MPAFQDQGQRRRLAGGRASFSSATTKSASDRLANFGRDGHGGGASESFDEDDDSCEDYDTEDGVGLESEEDLEDHDGSDFGAALVFSPDGYQDSSDSEADDDYKDSTTDPGTDDIEDGYASEELVDAASLDSLGSIASPGSRLPEANSSGDDDSVEVCVVTWNLAEETPPARDLEFLRHAAAGSDLVAVGVQEIENLKPRRNEGGRTREWRRLLIRYSCNCVIPARILRSTTSCIQVYLRWCAAMLGDGTDARQVGAHRSRNTISPSRMEQQSCKGKGTAEWGGGNRLQGH